jgi:Mg-chelatase subunit ChlD
VPAFEVDVDDLPDGWEAAQQYHRLKRVLPKHQRQEIEDRAVREILRRARDLLRHTSRPRHIVREPYPAPGELDLDATLEHPRPWKAEHLTIARSQLREADVVVILDMSLSMTGEKIALTALAAAILRLKLDHVAVVCFDTKAHKLVDLGEDVSAEELVRRILRVPAQGFTNVDSGLKLGHEILRRSHRRERAAIIMTDGVANVGGDPVKRAARIPLLHVVQVGEEEVQGTRTCEGMARAGRGRRYRAELYADLPAVVRRLVRECFGA